MKFWGVKLPSRTWRSNTVEDEDIENMRFPQFRKLKKYIQMHSSINCLKTQGRQADLKLACIKMLTAQIKVSLFIPRKRHLSSHIRIMKFFSILLLRCFKSEQSNWLIQNFFICIFLKDNFHDLMISSSTNWG